jgi:hypothetical protein
MYPYPKNVRVLHSYMYACVCVCVCECECENEAVKSEILAYLQLFQKLGLVVADLVDPVLPDVVAAHAAVRVCV